MLTILKQCQDAKQTLKTVSGYSNYTKVFLHSVPLAAFATCYAWKKQVKSSSLLPCLLREMKEF